MRKILLILTVIFASFGSLLAEDTDYLSIGTIKRISDEVSSVSLNLTNPNIEACAFQCDIVIPQNTSVSNVQIANTRCSDSHVIASNVLDIDGKSVLRILVYSLLNATFEGTEGAVASFDLIFSAGLSDASLLVRNIEIVDANCVIIRPEGNSALLYIVGDANCDSYVNVGDILAIATYIMGSTPDPFDLKAADADNNDIINVGDITMVATMILTR